MLDLKNLWNKAKDLFDKAEHIYIFTHSSMDGDALGSLASMTMVMRKLGYENATAVLGEMPTETISYLSMPTSMKITASPEVCGTDKDVAILVDCANIGRLTLENQRIANACGKKIKIDHHLPCEASDFADVDMSDPSWAATCEGLCDIFKVIGISFDYELAIRLYAGILTDSGMFTYSCTTPKTLRNVADLVEVTGTNVRFVAERHFEKKEFTSFKLIGVAFDKMKLLHSGQMVTCIFDRDDYIKAGADISQSGEIVSELLKVKTAKVALFIRPSSMNEGETEYRISMRCEEPYDVGSICQLFGGGGHKCASGATIKERNPLEVAEIISEKVKEQLSK